MEIIRKLVLLIICLNLVIYWSPLVKGNEVGIELHGPKELEVGSTFNISVDVTNISYFDAANFDIIFNPDYITVNNVFNGNINDTEIPVSMWNIIDENKLRVILNLPGIEGVSGDGTLTTIEFNSIKSGSITINVNNSVLSNIEAVEIPANWNEYQINVLSNDSETDNDEQLSQFPWTLIILIILVVIAIAIIWIFLKQKKQR